MLHTNKSKIKNAIILILFINVLFINNIYAQRAPDNLSNDCLGYLVAGILFAPGETEKTVSVSVPVPDGYTIAGASAQFAYCSIGGGNIVYFRYYSKERLRREVEGLPINAREPFPGTIWLSSGQKSLYYYVNVIWDYDNIVN